ncbi:MAG: YigZ family protein [Chloroflexota bacterium]
MSSRYYRPTEAIHRTEIEILKSRFITSVTQVTTTESARDFIKHIRDEMPEASHHVYAFRVGYGQSVTDGMSDDGEPNGTSGPPSLAVVRGSNLGDIVLVTTRYFGGTKLGTGGLVRAYTESAQVALESLPTVLKAPKTQLGFDMPYSLYEQSKLLIIEHNGIINDEIFTGDVSLIVTFYNENVEAFTTELTELSSGQIEPIPLATFDD